MIGDRLIALVIVSSGAVFIVFAQLARRRAVAMRGVSLRTSGGLVQLVPYFFWVPYAVVVAGLGPSVPRPDWAVLAGLVLTIAGVAFSLWSVITLGRHYDLVLEVHAGHELVRAGPYRFVRHPVYTGLGLHFLGACIASGNVLLAAGTLFITLPAFYLRARSEERLLRERFGAEYEAYAKEVGMLVPLR